MTFRFQPQFTFDVPKKNAQPSVNVVLHCMKLIFDFMDTFCRTLSKDNNRTNDEWWCICCNIALCSRRCYTRINTIYFGYCSILPPKHNDVMMTLLDPWAYHTRYCTVDKIYIKTRQWERHTKWWRKITSLYVLWNKHWTKWRNRRHKKYSHDGADNDGNDDNNENDYHVIYDSNVWIWWRIAIYTRSIFDFTQGKYQYEICMYHGSKQEILITPLVGIEIV
jgi:hypothetical protein